METVRFYQRSGLLKQPRRLGGGYREYSESDVRRILFIKRAQSLGFNLDDVAGLLRLDGPQICSKTHDLTARKLQVVEEKIAALTSIRDALNQMVHHCELDHERGTCPIIEALVQGSNPIPAQNGQSAPSKR